MKIFYQSLFLLFTLLLGNNLYAEKALLQINNFVKSQTKTITAYDLEEQFKTMMTDPSFGALSTVSASSTASIGITALDNTYFVVTYNDVHPNPQAQKAVVGQIDINTTSIVGYGTPVLVGDNSGDISVVALTASKFVVVLKDDADVSGYVSVCERLGTSITTVGTQATFNNNVVQRMEVKKLTSAKFVITYQDGGNSHHGTAIIGTVSGTTITLGSKVAFNTAITTVSAVFIINSNSFIVFYNNWSGSVGQAKIGTVSGTTITFASAFTFSANQLQNLNLFCSPLTATKFALVWLDATAGNLGKVCIGDVSGSTIAFGSAMTFNPNSSFDVQNVTGINSTEIALFYENASGALVSKIGTVSGTTITLGNEVTVDANGTKNYSYTATMTPSHFLLAYRNEIAQGQYPVIAIGSNGTTILPVELIDFKGQKIENAIKLTWQTASEENNDGFEIQRSKDGREWETIDFIHGNGTTLEISNYEYLDENPFESINYYRLKQMDFDGQYEYSNIIIIKSRIPVGAKVEPRIFPNPVQDELNLVNSQGQSVIYNLLGQPIKSFQIPNSNFQINTSDLPNGQYIVQIVQENKTLITKRFVKQ